jgi:Circularly permutated YpsA SLOG family
MMQKVVSGAQTGADRAALDWAIFREIPHGGWCPKGRKAEDGKIPLQYQLTETPSASYLQRTEWNVRDSDGTVIFTVAAELAGGSKRTADFANKHGKPWLHLSERGSYESPGERLAAFVRENDIKALNVAGSRGSKEPGVAAFVRRVLEDAFFRWSQGPVDGPEEG